MDAKKIRQQLQGRSMNLKIRGGYVPPKPPVTTARIKPTSPPPKKETDEKSN